MDRWLLLLLVLALLTWTPSRILAVDAVKEEALIGWQGESWDATRDQAQDNEDAASPPKAKHRHRKEGWIETISWTPRAFVFHGFLTHAECDHLTKIGDQRVHRSLVVDAKTGGSMTDDIRTSYGAAFGRGEDPIIAAVEEKIAEWTHLPAEYGEPMQILRYVDGQKYGAHWDWFDGEAHKKQNAGLPAQDNRYATVLMYLSEGVEGGETSLPLAVGIDPAAQAIPNASECSLKGTGLAVVPQKGDALLFFDMDIEGHNGDRAALHASCPTTAGIKWTATKWIHNHIYGGSYDALKRAMSCQDILVDCARRARTGDCESDPALTGAGGTCRKTCKDCIDCQPGDLVCGRANMKGRLKRNSEDDEE